MQKPSCNRNRTNFNATNQLHQEHREESRQSTAQHPSDRQPLYHTLSLPPSEEQTNVFRLNRKNRTLIHLTTSKLPLE